MSRADRAEQRQTEILAVAAEFVAERGFHGMSMRDLARATGKNISTLYNDFPSKESLLLAIQLRAFETLTGATAEACAPDLSPSQRLFCFIYQHVRYVVSNPAVMRILVAEAGALGPEQRAQVRELKVEYFSQLRGIVGDVAGVCGVDAGVELATYNIFGMLNWVYGWYEGQRHGGTEDIARAIHGMALGGIAMSLQRSAGTEELERALNLLNSDNLLAPTQAAEARTA